MLAVLSEFERDLISERTATALAHKRAQGKRISRFTPYGLDLAGDGVTVIENAVEQKRLSLIRQLRERGLSLHAIADDLNAQGICAKLGGRWTHQSVAGILKRAVA